MLIVAIVLLIAAAALAGVALTCLLERLPRNRWLGVRSPATLRSDEAFTVGNKVAAPTLLAAAAMLLVGGLGALLADGAVAIVITVLCVLGGLLTAGAGAAVGAKAAAALPEAEGACGSACGTCSLKDACATPN